MFPDDWTTTANVTRKTDKETWWWWNEEVQEYVRRKRLAKKLRRSGTLSELKRVDMSTGSRR